MSKSNLLTRILDNTMALGWVNLLDDQLEVSKYEGSRSTTLLEEEKSASVRSGKKSTWHVTEL